MSKHDSFAMLRLTAAAALLAGMLAACSKPPATEPPPSPSPTGDAPAPALPPAETAPPDTAPAAPVQPPPEAPPPTEPSPAPKPTAAANEPALDTMQVARPANSKLSVPVDLRYHFDGDVQANQPVVLHLAAVPRVAGSNLEVSLKQVSGMQYSTGTLNVQKANASGVYRQQFSVTRQASGPAEIRVLVTMGVGEASGFGFFSIPLDGGNSSQKLDSVKQR